MSKQRQQVIIIGAVWLAIAGALLYVNFNKFIPTPSGQTGEFAIPVRPALPRGVDAGLLSRPDFPESQAGSTEPDTSTEGVEDIFAPLP